MNLFNKILNKRNKSFISLFSMVVIPTLIITVALFSVLIYNYNSTLDLHTRHVSNILFQASDSCESKISSLSDVCNILSDIPTIKDALEQTDYSYTPVLSQKLNNISTSYSYIENIYIYNKTAREIYSEKGVYPSDEYFRTSHIYENYNHIYWADFAFYHSEPHRILSPTSIKKDGVESAVVPVVFQKANNIDQNNYLVFDVNFKELINIQNANNSMTPTSRIYFLNKYSNDVFSTDNNTFSKIEFNIDFIDLLLESSKSTFEHKFDFGNAIVSHYSPNDSLVGYTYFAIIPSSDITSALLPDIIMSVSIIILFLLLSLLLVFRNTRQIFNPLKNIFNILTHDENYDTSGNILNDIVTLASDAQTKKDEFNYILPCAQEKFLVNLLNSTDYSMDTDARNSILKSFAFPYELFYVVIIQLSPTPSFYDVYTSSEYNHIKSGVFNIVKDMFSLYFPCYILPAEHDILYVLLNMEKPDQTSNVDKIINSIYSDLENDSEHINISVGKSNVHRDIEGLKLAHDEALNNFVRLDSATSHIVLNTSGNNEDINFDNTSQSALYHALLSSDADTTYAIIDDALKKNTGHSPRLKKKLYNSILNIVIKAMRFKKIPYKNDMLDFEIVNACLNQPTDTAYNDMMILVDYTLKRSETNNSPVSDYDDVIKYIDKNYTFPDLSLKFLSDYFNVNQSSLSTLIKEKLSMGFHEYLTELRISKAKQLLLTSDKNISDIYLECGFSSRQTFFRVFKTATGLTPTEFKKTDNS